MGLLGLPNAGKSTLISAISAARPKVADYPFTTLYPNLGVVRIDHSQSFVVADIPGLIEGAADGAGLGIRFLKHLSRTHLLLHLVDVSPYSDSGDALQDIATIEAELAKYSDELAARERWLVLNKIDLIDPEEQLQYQRDIVEALNWKEPVFTISAVSGEGTQTLIQQIMHYLQTRQETEETAHSENALSDDAGTTHV